MAKLYFNTCSEVEKYLKNELGLIEDDVLDFDMELTDYEEESYKRSTEISGYIHDSVKDVYYSVRFTGDYDWGNSDYYLDTEPFNRHEYEETVVVKKTKYTPVNKNTSQ